MKVILLADVKNIGEKGDIVEVARGYGRNFLLPRGLAVKASTSNLRQVEHEKQAEKQKVRRELKKAQKAGAKIEGKTAKVVARVGEAGRLFGSITSQEIAEQLRRQYAVEIDKRKIELQEPIKSLGTYSVLVKIHPEVHVSLQIEVVGE
ncbi:MAG: 50S ribosomal protein L9 [Firmicutes bacterium]|nr:50S ribosomal protein L9 [Bacillota bacterium]